MPDRARPLDDGSSWIALHNFPPPTCTSYHAHTHIDIQTYVLGCQCQPRGRKRLRVPGCGVVFHTSWANSTHLSPRRRTQLPTHTTIHTQEDKTTPTKPGAVRDLSCAMLFTQMWCCFCAWASGSRAPLPILVRTFRLLGKKRRAFLFTLHATMPQITSPHSMGR